jgi:hypothetical protein
MAACVVKDQTFGKTNDKFTFAEAISGQKTNNSVRTFTILS